MQPIVTDRVAWSVCLSVCHSSEPCKNKMLFGLRTQVGRGNHVLDCGSAHWHHLANTTEPSICSGDVACCQITLITHTTISRPFFRNYPGEQDFMVQGKITEADTPTIRLSATPTGPISDPPPSYPPFLCRMPFLPQPSYFALAWNRHQICWLAYPVAWYTQWHDYPVAWFTQV